MGDETLQDKSLAGDENPWIVWKEGEKTFSDQALSRPLAQTLCTEVGTAGYHGFIQEVKTATTFKGLIILPFAKKYVLSILCNQGNMTATAINPISSTAGWGTSGATSNLTLNTITDTAKSSLKHFVESIENNRMCFTPGQSGIDLSWNKEYLISKGEQKETNAEPKAPTSKPKQPNVKPKP